MPAGYRQAGRQVGPHLEVMKVLIAASDHVLRAAADPRGGQAHVHVRQPPLAAAAAAAEVGGRPAQGIGDPQERAVQRKRCGAREATTSGFRVLNLAGPPQTKPSLASCMHRMHLTRSRRGFPRLSRFKTPLSRIPEEESLKSIYIFRACGLHSGGGAAPVSASLAVLKPVHSGLKDKTYKT